MATEKDPISKKVTLWISGKYTRLTFLPGITPFAQLPSVPYVPGPIPFNITYMQLFNQNDKARQTGNLLYYYKFVDKTGTGKFTNKFGYFTTIDSFAPNVVTEVNDNPQSPSGIIQQQLNAIPKIDKFGVSTAGKPLAKTLCLAKDAAYINAAYIVVSKNNMIQWVNATSGKPFGPKIQGTANNLGNPPTASISSYAGISGPSITGGPGKNKFISYEWYN